MSQDTTGENVVPTGGTTNQVLAKASAADFDFTWATIAGGGDALVANPLSQFASTTSAQLRGIISDETGTGALVFANSPTLVTPNIGAATATSLVVAGDVSIGTASSVSGYLKLWNEDNGFYTDLVASGTSGSNKHLSLPNTDGVLVEQGFAQTLENKTISSANNTLVIALSSLTSDTTTTVGLGKLELGHANDTTIERSSAGAVLIEGVLVATSSNSLVLTNKTISGASNTITNVSLTTGVTGTLPVANGGTGTTSLTANNVLLGNGTSAVQVVAPGASGNVLTSNGTTWQSTAPAAGGDTLVVLGSDVANSTTSFADITGMTFAVTSGETYHFDAVIVYTSAATATGSKWSVNGPATPTLLAYRTESPTTTTTSRIDYADTYDTGGPSTQSPGITNLIAKIEGIVKVSASGTFAMRFGSEVASSAITAKAGSVLRWRKVLP